MNILAWVIFGIIIGIVTGALTPERAQGGVLGMVLLGIAGALCGGLITELLFGLTATSLSITSLVIAVGGSLLVLVFGRKIVKV